MQQAQAWGQLTGQPVAYSQVVNKLGEFGLTVPKVRPQVDGHAILARELGTWLKGDESQALPQAIQDLVELKHAEHMQLLQMAQMAEMQARSGVYPTSGYLSNPGGQQGATQQQQNSTSPARQGGEMREMEQVAQ